MSEKNKNLKVGRNPVLVAAEEWKKANPNKTLAEYRKLNPDVPPLKIKSGKNQPLSIALKTKGTTDSEKLRKVKQVQSPGITAAEKAKRKKLFDTVEWMRHVDPDGGWNIEHVERVKDFDGKKFGISHKADDLPNLKINSGTDAKHKTAWESFGDKWDLPPNKLKSSRQFVQLVTNHNKVCVYKSTFKIFISIYIHQ